MRCITDIRKYLTSLNLAIFSAFLAAFISTLDSHSHGSHANRTIMEAGHWVLLAAITSEKVRRVPGIPVFMLYGFMMGELDLDAMASVGLTALSACAFWHHYAKAGADTAVPAAVGGDELEGENATI